MIPDLPLKRLGAGALCQLMFRVMPVSLKDSLMRPRQAHCAQPSGAENLKANHSTIALVSEKKIEKGERILCNFFKIATKSLDPSHFSEMATESWDAARHSKVKS